jgi:hypothetical protein
MFLRSIRKSFAADCLSKVTMSSQNEIIFGSIYYVSRRRNCILLLNRWDQNFLPPEESSVFYATQYEANGTSTPPAFDNPEAGSGPGGSSFIIPQAGCVVQGEVSLSSNTQYSFGLALRNDWNGRFLYVLMVSQLLSTSLTSSKLLETEDSLGESAGCLW